MEPNLDFIVSNLLKTTLDTSIFGSTDIEHPTKRGRFVSQPLVLLWAFAMRTKRGRSVSQPLVLLSL